MPAATNILKTLNAGEATGKAQPTPASEAFAAMLAVETSAETVGDTAPGEEAIAATPEVAEPQPNLDILAPLLAQQQVVPTVTVPNAGGETITTETAVTGAVGAAPQSPLVLSEVEGRTAQILEPGTLQQAPSTSAPDQALTDALRLRSGRAEGLELPQAPQVAQAVEGTGAEVQVTLGEAKASGKSDAPASQPVTATTLTASAPTSGDQQPSGGEPQPESPAATIEPQTRQPSSGFSATDLRSLVSSLTGAGNLASATGPGQAGAAQQLGQALAAQVLDLAGGNEWLEQITQEIGRAADGSGPLRFRLTPESLGELKVEISQGDRGALVRMTVSTEAAQAALADAQPRLAAEARAQGVRIADTQVDLANSQSQQQGRESASRQAAQAEQPLRAFRAGAGASTSTQTQAEPPSGRSAERYA